MKNKDVIQNGRYSQKDFQILKLWSTLTESEKKEVLKRLEKKARRKREGQ